VALINAGVLHGAGNNDAEVHQSDLNLGFLLNILRIYGVGDLLSELELGLASGLDDANDGEVDGAVLVNKIIVGRNVEILRVVAACHRSPADGAGLSQIHTFVERYDGLHIGRSDLDIQKVARSEYGVVDMRAFGKNLGGNCFGINKIRNFFGCTAACK